MKKFRVHYLLLLSIIVLFSACSETNRLHQKAIDSSEAGNYNKALKNYHKILKKKPDKPLILNDYAWTLFMVDSLEKSIEVLERAKKLQAEKNVLLQRAIDRNLTIARTYLEAREHLENGEPQEALEALSKQKLYRSREMELVYYGMIYEKLEEEEKARERWQKIIDTYAEVSFDNKFYDLALKKMDKE